MSLVALLAAVPPALAALPPIAGPGTEMLTIVPATYGHCGRCGYTGRVRGPKQIACGDWIWHGWLEKCADEESHRLL